MTIAEPPRPPSLFDASPHRARATDRPTAHAAARLLDPKRVGRQIRDVVRVVAAAGERGAICADVVAHLGRDRGCVSRRLTDAERRDLIREDGTRPGPSGRAQIVWKATSSGLSLAAQALADEASR